MSFLSKLFGGTDTAKEAVKLASDSIRGIGNWVDEKELTKEEETKFAIKAAEMQLELVKSTANENSVRSVTRRYLAWGITGFVLLNAQLAIVMLLLDKAEIVKGIIAIAESFSLGWAFVGLVGFYFGVQFVRK
jgi:hypothetical protein